MPVFEGLDSAATPVLPISAQPTGNSQYSTATPPSTKRISAQPTGNSKYTPAGPSATSWILTEQDRARFTAFFESCSPVSGTISGQQARDVFLKSQLSIETLGQIWRLSNPSGLPKISLDGFLVAMCLITKLKTGQISTLPATAPVELLNSAKTGNASTSDAATAKSTARPELLPSSPGNPANPALSDTERTAYNGYFVSLDTTKKGYLTGAESYAFFLKSRLPEADLASVWDYVDSAKSGVISKDGFITAMHIIKQRMGGAPLPTKAAQVADLLGEPIPQLKPVPAATLPDMLQSTLPEPLSFPVEPPKTILTNANAILLPTTDTLPQKPIVALEQAAPGFKFNPSSSFNMFRPAVPVGNIEYNMVAEMQVDLNAKKDEVKLLIEQLQKSHPSAAELKKKRESVEEEARQVSEKRNQLTIELSKSRATYEADAATYQDIQQRIQRENILLTAVQQELEQYQGAVKSLGQEKATLQKHLGNIEADMLTAKQKISQATEETNAIRTSVAHTKAEIQKQQQLLEVNDLLLQKAQEDFKIMKSELSHEEERLELARKRTQQLQMQADVQGEITRKEKQKVEDAELRQRMEHSKSKDLSNSIENLKLVEEKSKQVIVTLPNTPAPPVPSLSSKPESRPDLASFPDDEMFTNPNAEIIKPQTTGKSDFDDFFGEPVTNSNQPTSIATKNNIDDFFNAKSLESTAKANSQPTLAPRSETGDSQSSFDFRSELNFPKTKKDTKDTASLRSNTSAIFSKTKGFNDDAFTFDSSFSAPQKVDSPAIFTSPLASSTHKDTSTAKPVVFSAAFAVDMTPPTATNLSKSPAKSGIDNAFGAIAGDNSISAGFGDDPFGTADFGAAFKDAPAPAEVPHVANMMQMGFTRDQSLSALEKFILANVDMDSMKLGPSITFWRVQVKSKTVEKKSQNTYASMLMAGEKVWANIKLSVSKSSTILMHQIILRIPFRFLGAYLWRQLRVRVSQKLHAQHVASVCMQHMHMPDYQVPSHLKFLLIA